MSRLTDSTSGSSCLRFSAVAAGRFVLFLIAGMLLFMLLFDGLQRAFGYGKRIDWQLVLSSSVFLGILLFGFQFSLIYTRLRAYSRAGAMLEEGQAPPRQLSRTAYFGFAALEGDAFSSLRTFVIFVTPEALYGWKVEEAFLPPGPGYFLPYTELLQQPELTHDLERIKGLASLRGGFVLSRSRLASAEFYPKRIWWLGAIPHAGRLVITSTSGCKRKFILLGRVDGSSIRARILWQAAT